MIFRHCAKYSRNFVFSAKKILFPPKSLVNLSKCNQSMNSLSTLENPIVITDDGSTIVCWHPEKEFPYEFTKPLPARTVDQENPRVLKTSEEAAYKIFKKQSPEVVREELMKMTFTTKHRWFPRSRDKKAKKTPMDRRYL